MPPVIRTSHASGTSNYNGSRDRTLNISPSGDNRIIIAFSMTGNSSVQDAGKPTFDGNLMSDLGLFSNNGNRIEGFYYLKPGTGSKNVVFGLSDADDFVVYAAAYKNVLQIAPLFEGRATSSGNASDIIATVNPGDLVVDAVNGNRDGDHGEAAWVKGSGQTQEAQVTSPGDTFSGNIRIGISTEPGSGNNVTMSWTLDGGRNHSQFLVALRSLQQRSNVILLL